MTELEADLERSLLQIQLVQQRELWLDGAPHVSREARLELDRLLDMWNDLGHVAVEAEL